MEHRPPNWISVHNWTARPSHFFSAVDDGASTWIMLTTVIREQHSPTHWKTELLLLWIILHSSNLTHGFSNCSENLAGSYTRSCNILNLFESSFVVCQLPAGVNQAPKSNSIKKSVFLGVKGSSSLPTYTSSNGALILCEAKKSVDKWAGLGTDISDDQQDIARGKGLVDSLFQVD